MSITVSITELRYQHGSSNKFYRVFEWPGTTALQYGRIGTYGTFSRKNTGIAQKKLDEKYGKGYTLHARGTVSFPGVPTDDELERAANQLKPNGTARTPQKLHVPTAAGGGWLLDATVLKRVRETLFASVGVWPEDQVASASRPMLAQTADPKDLDFYIGADDWGMQPKLDGDRFMVEVKDGQVAVLNRQGQPKTSNVSTQILDHFRHLHDGHWLFDGEIVGTRLWLFDLMHAEGFIHEGMPFEKRYQALMVIVMSLIADPNDIALVPLATSTAGKQKMLDTAIAEQREGVMFRALEAPYLPAKRSQDLLKHKFIKTADCMVTALGVGGKENATLSVFSDDMSGLVECGAASTIGKGELKVGDVVEVNFLYVLDPAAPRMYQPRIVKVRTDKAPVECVLSRFADAGTNKEH